MSLNEKLVILKNEIEHLRNLTKYNNQNFSLIAVSKTKPIEMIEELSKAGQVHFGENNILEALDKAEKLKEYDIKWHLIGSVQTNKVKYITRFCDLLHSLDRKSLANKLQKRLEIENKNLDCLIQVNTSKEESKSGVYPNEVIDFAKYVSTLPNLKVKGLMTIGENSGIEKNIRENFRELKKIFENIKSLNLPNFNMQELSMGMSGDYKIAIEEGATMVRIGSAIFGTRV